MLALALSAGISVIARTAIPNSAGVVFVLGILVAVKFVATITAMWGLWCLVSGRCRACYGSGIDPASIREMPFLWRQDRERLQPGTCRRCRYDLTGADVEVCPECGTAVLDEGSADPTGDDA